METTIDGRTYRTGAMGGLVYWTSPYPGGGTEVHILYCSGKASAESHVCTYPLWYELAQHGEFGPFVRNILGE